MQKYFRKFCISQTLEGKAADLPLVARITANAAFLTPV
jgi:hypothetical protein